MAKRGASGISRLIAVAKPCGMTSHDVVNRCRRVFGERRVGHAGTLDPLASGVLVVCVGPATRLDAYLVGHSKRYRMGVQFGLATDTDDAEGSIIKQIPAPEKLLDRSFASSYVANMVGEGMQVPPIYSAIKVDGRKSYDAARKGTIIDLEARPFEIHEALLEEVRESVGLSGEIAPEWIVDMKVSKGTYMRSIARDMGRDLKTAAYVSSLERTQSGSVALVDCVTLDELEQYPDEATIDPLKVLGIRFAFARGCEQQVLNGSFLPEQALSLNEPIYTDVFTPCTCTTSVIASNTPPHNGEIIGVLLDNRLKALYEYCGSEHRYRARCVFSIGVERGRAV